MIVVAGEALVDLIARPDGSLAAHPGGGPYNAARAIGRLGLPVAWMGGLSSDRFGRDLERRLVADGVSLDLVQRTDAPTTLAVAELDATGSATYRFYTDGTSAPQVLPEPFTGLPSGTHAVHVGTLGFVLEPMASTLEALVGQLPSDTLLMIDPNCRPSLVADPRGYRERLARVLARADLVKVSTEDLAFLRPDEDPSAAAAWVRSLGARAVLVTDGARGVNVHVGGPAEGRPAQAVVEVRAVEVVDTVGAGDTFGAAALAWLVHAGVSRDRLALSDLVRATGFGVRAAGVTCARPGADPPTLQELGGWDAS